MNLRGPIWLRWRRKKPTNHDSSRSTLQARPPQLRWIRRIDPPRGRCSCALRRRRSAKLERFPVFMLESAFCWVGDAMRNPRAVRYRRLALAEPDQEKARLLHQLAGESDRGVLFNDAGVWGAVGAHT